MKQPTPKGIQKLQMEFLDTQRGEVDQARVTVTGLKLMRAYTTTGFINDAQTTFDQMATVYTGKVEPVLVPRQHRVWLLNELVSGSLKVPPEAGVTIAIQGNRVPFHEANISISDPGLAQCMVYLSPPPGNQSTSPPWKQPPDVIKKMT